MRLLLPALLFVPGAVFAGVDASGYLKQLSHATRSPLTRAPYTLHLSRARLNLEAQLPLEKPKAGGEPPGRLFLVHAEYDHELRTGSFIDSADFRRFGLAEPPEHFSMSQTISSGTDGHYRHRLYRGWAELQAEGFHLRFGRQRIAWGVGKIWNPTDFLNPHLPTSLEPGERRGVDALYLRRGDGSLGQGELVYTLGRRWSESDLVARLRGHAGRVDASLLGGKVASSSSSWTLGSDLAADVLDGTIHVETNYTELGAVPPFWKLLLGYEYAFSSAPPWPWLKDLWATVEYFHNGHGEKDARRYNRALLLSGREVSLGRDYLGLALKKELHPLVEIEGSFLLNLSDESHFFGPSISWNAFKDLHLSAGWQRFGGRPVSEYGTLANIAYGQAQYYF